VSLTISNVSEKIRRQTPAIHWMAVIGKLEDRFSWLVSRNVARHKISRNSRLILNSGFFVRGLPDW
jgi:hypothetical protein